MIHFDTNFVVQAIIAGTPASSKFLKWNSTPEDYNVCAIVWAEFLCGPLDGTDESFARKVFPIPEPLPATDAGLAAILFNQTGRRSRSLAGCMIAAVAIRCGAKRATINASDFRPFVQHGLLLA